MELSQFGRRNPTDGRRELLRKCGEDTEVDASAWSSSSRSSVEAEVKEKTPAER